MPHLLGGLQLEALPLVDRIGELAEGVGHLPSLHEHLEPLRVPGLRAVGLRQRAHLWRHEEEEDRKKSAM